MAHHHRRRPREEALGGVHVGAADAGRGDLDHHLPGPAVGSGRVIESETDSPPPGRDLHVRGALACCENFGITSVASSSIERRQSAGPVPVVAAHEQGAEVAGLLAERHQLLEHPARAARDDEGPLDHVLGDVLVGDQQIGLQHEERLAALREAVVEEVVVEREPVVRVREILLRLRVALGDQHAARHAPDARIGPPSGPLAALHVLLPVALEIAAVEELAGYRDPAALARGGRAVRVGGEQRERDRRVRLLVGPRHVAHLELGPDAVGRARSSRSGRRSRKAGPGPRA